jgi:hypothetical protein
MPSNHYRMRRLSILTILFLLAGSNGVWALAIDATEKHAVVERTGKLLLERYIYPEMASQAGAFISDALKTGKYDVIADPTAFAARLTNDLRSVTHDPHIKVFVTAEQFAAPDPASSAARAPMKAGFVAVARLKGNIGYIKLNAFPSVGSFRPAANLALSNLAATSSLIIDLRDNGGGEPESVAYLCSFFFDPKTPVHLDDVIARVPGTKTFSRQEYWTKKVPTSYLGKPVYLLTSKRTFSGGEEFANDLKVLRRVRVVGETTAGGAHPTDGADLNKRFGIFIPWGRAENPLTKSDWEGTGVAPDEATSSEEAFRTAMLDVTQDAGLKRQLAQHSDVASYVESSLPILK